MTSDMVARVAAAIHCCADEASAEEMAIAAITAMKDETESMIIAGTNARLSTGLSTYNETPSMWKAMIDAALGENK